MLEKRRYTVSRFARACAEPPLPMFAALSPSGFRPARARSRLRPLWRLMREEVLRSTKLFVDETRRRCSIRPRPNQDGLLLGARPR